MKSIVLATTLAACSLVASSASAQVSFTGSALTQNFDSLVTSGTATWTNNTTLPGWSLFRQPAPGTEITSYASADGSANAGGFFSLGTGTATERALGGIGSGGAYFGSPATNTVAGWIAFAATNNTGTNLTSATILYDGEQWRNGGNTSAQTMVLEYGIGTAFTGVTWTAAGNPFNFTSTINTATAAALNGNLAANRAADLGGNLNVAWNSGSTLWIRWTELNDTGNDHGLAVDNFRLSSSVVTTVPEASTVALFAPVLGVLGVIVARRRKLA